MQIIIVGGGPAAVAAALQARKYAPQSSITIFSAESILPYRRPQLIKMLAAPVAPARFFIHDQQFYDDHNIQIKLNSRVIAVNWPENCIVLSDHTQVSYDRLLLAYGASARTLPGIISNESNHSLAPLHDWSDIEKIRQMIDHANSPAIVGGGVLGLECAALIARKGFPITVIERSPSIMHGVMDEECAVFLKNQLKNLYPVLNIMTNCQVKNIRSNSDGSLRCAINSHLTGQLTLDAVILTLGFQSAPLPWQPPVKNSRLEVDKFMQLKGFENIFAAGDCAFYPGVSSGSYLNAIEMGSIAGGNITGAVHEPIRLRVPEMRAVFGDFKLYCAGDTTGADLESAAHIRQDSLRKLYYRHNRLAGCVLLGDISNNADYFQTIRSHWAQN